MSNPSGGGAGRRYSADAGLISSFLFFLKKPQAFPLLLSIFVLLTWLSLRFHHPPSSPSLRSSQLLQHDSDKFAHLVRFSSSSFPSLIFNDPRGWLLNPALIAQRVGISEGPFSCTSVHVGEIRPGGVRGNHRHHTCNETFVFWGAQTKFRLERDHVDERNYAESTIGPEEVAVSVSMAGTAHALINVDSRRNTFFLGCQDNVGCSNQSTDYKVWKDL